MPLHSGSRQARVGEALAGRIQPNQSRLSRPRRAQCPAPLPRAPRVPCLQNPRSPALRRWQEVEDSSDEFLEFILVDYVARTFDVLDISPGEEALDLRIVIGAAGQGNTPWEAWSDVCPGVFPHPPQAEWDPRSDHVPFPAGAVPRFPLVLQRFGITGCWRYRAHSRNFPIAGASSHPQQLQKTTRGQTTDSELLLPSPT